MRSIVWMSEPLSRTLPELPSSEITFVNSAREFFDTQRGAKAIAFVDSSTIASLRRVELEHGVRTDQMVPVIAICDEPLQTAIGWLAEYPWLSHVVGVAMLQHPMAAGHLGHVMSTLASSSHPKLLDWLGTSVTGRRVRLAQASRRVDRLERMSDFLDSRSVGSRTIHLIRDIAEELLTNAFYDAPVAAGVVKQPISRIQDVSLPDDGACDMVYGCSDDLVVVRVRDPFGSLSRTRLVNVLSRCARTDMQVEVDETMGGAGLGLWRIFSAASFVAIAVVKNRYTEFLVGIGKRISAARRPFAVHLFFKEQGRTTRRWRSLEDSNKPTVNKSVTIVAK